MSNATATPAAAAPTRKAGRPKNVLVSHMGGIYSVNPKTYQNVLNAVIAGEPIQSIDGKYIGPMEANFDHLGKRAAKALLMIQTEPDTVVE